MLRVWSFSFVQLHCFLISLLFYFRCLFLDYSHPWVCGAGRDACMFGWAVMPISFYGFFLFYLSPHRFAFLTFASLLVQWFFLLQEYLLSEELSYQRLFKNFFPRGIYISFVGVNFTKDRGTGVVVFWSMFQMLHGFSMSDGKPSLGPTLYYTYRNSLSR